jgi:hypothetical protein
MYGMLRSRWVSHASQSRRGRACDVHIGLYDTVISCQLMRLCMSTASIAQEDLASDIVHNSCAPCLNQA